MPTTTIGNYEPGFAGSKIMARKFHSCMQKAKELNAPSQQSKSNGANAGEMFDTMGCAFGGVGAVGSIMSSVKEAQGENQKLQIHLLNRSPYVVIPQRLNFDSMENQVVDRVYDSYRTVSAPGPLKPGEHGEYEVDCDKSIRKDDSSFDGTIIEVLLSVVSLSGRAIVGYTKWQNNNGKFYLPAYSNYGPERVSEHSTDFQKYEEQMTRFKKNLYVQSVLTNDSAYPQFGVATSSAAIGQSDEESTHLNFEIFPWEINPEAFVKDETLALASTSEVKNIGGYNGGLNEYAVPIGLKIWNQVLRDLADDNPSNTNIRGFASAMVPFGGMAQAGASMLTGLISGARGLVRDKKSKVPINVNVKNMTSCTMAIGRFVQTENGYCDSNLIPPGEDGNFMLTDDLKNTDNAEVSFFFATDDEQDNDDYIICEWENKDGMCQMYKVQCRDYFLDGSESICHGRNIDDWNNIWHVESIYFQVPVPKSSNMIVCCTQANNGAEQELALTFAN